MTYIEPCVTRENNNLVKYHEESLLLRRNSYHARFYTRLRSHGVVKK